MNNERFPNLCSHLQCLLEHGVGKTKYCLVSRVRSCVVIVFVALQSVLVGSDTTEHMCPPYPGQNIVTIVAIRLMPLSFAPSPHPHLSYLPSYSCLLTYSVLLSSSVAPVLFHCKLRIYRHIESWSLYGDNIDDQQHNREERQIENRVFDRESIV